MVRFSLALLPFVLAAAADDLDRDIQALLNQTGVPGAAIAIAKDGRLVYARGYGVADLSTGEPVRPDSLFRLGSVSKTVTAVALLHLYERGNLDLEAPAYLGIQPLPGARPDSRTAAITIRHLLHHTGGCGRDTGTDPLNAAAVLEAARLLGVSPPAGPDALVRYVMGLPLESDPGSTFSYSNYGFLLLARVLERLSGQPYETFVRNSILAPMNIRRMALGRADPLPGEVRYYELPRPVLELSLAPGARRLLPRPYANFETLAGDGCGRWVASPIDLVRFISHIEGSRLPAFLQPATFDLMLERPSPFVSQDRTGKTWYGLGTVASSAGNGRSWSHSGAYAGNLAAYGSLGNGVVYAFAFNAWPPDFPRLLTGAADAIEAFCLNQRDWPSHDLFEN
jgi:CubicO group peptidase (beta-lactamase class C family)